MPERPFPIAASPKTPELIAPAGDWDCAKAAVENGADGVYFGLRSGLNARARAVNFSPEELPELLTYFRRRGVKGYLTLNTLVFSDELETAEATIRLAAAADVDALIVQDLGLLRLARQVCPDLPLHASTQMTLGSAECIAEAATLGVSRVVLPRELSLAEIAEIHRQTSVELEVFVHGALCISYSGQCLASLALGGRSGNRGQCAQACRLKYEFVEHGKDSSRRERGEVREANRGGQSPFSRRLSERAKRDLSRREKGDSPLACEKGDSPRPYLLSPRDLAAFDFLPEMIAAGVAALKIEGRMKGADYVAVVTRFYRRAVDEAAAGRRAEFSAEEIAELEAAFTRGFSHGWFDGPNHRTLVAGESSAKRGVLLGEVRGVRGERVRVALTSAVRLGMGVVFEGDRDAGEEQGGRIYEIFSEGRSVGQVSYRSEPQNDRLETCPTATDDRLETCPTVIVELAFRHGALDFGKIAAGQKVWMTDDPQMKKKWRQITRHGDSQRRVPLSLTIEAICGQKLIVFGQTTTGATCRLESSDVLAEAEKHPLTEETLNAQFGRLGGTDYELRGLDACIVGRPMVPFSELGKLRREMVEQLDASLASPAARAVFAGSAVDFLREEDLRIREGEAPAEPSELRRLTNATAARQEPRPPKSSEPQLRVLCRSLEQIEAAVKCGSASAIADFRDVERYGDAVEIARSAGCAIWLATLRIHRPGGNEAFAELESERPDGILARNLAAIAYFRTRNTPVVADFSLNATNEFAFDELFRQGATRVTMAYDLRWPSRCNLLEAVPPQSIDVILHSRVPLMHTAHCLFCSELSTGRDQRDCGQPCRSSSVRLRDRQGVEHVLLADADCRNTLYHANAQSAAEFLPKMLAAGIRHFRVELLEEGAAETRRLVERYRKLLAC
jgi:U32 family peptidase